MKIMHFEDSIDKHLELFRVLRRIGIQSGIWVNNLNHGIREIEAVIKDGVPFDIAITDMNYPIKSGEAADGRAGAKLIQTLTEKNIDLPVIVCSTGNYRVPKMYGSVWYSDLSD